MVVSLVLLSLSLSLDALGVGVVYGLRHIKIPMKSKLLICLFSIVYAALALLFGRIMLTITSPYTAKIIGIIILIGMGLWIILQSICRPVAGPCKAVKTQPSDPENMVLQVGIKSLGIIIQIIRDPEAFDVDHSGSIDSRESILLGLALSVDAIGAGIGSALIGFQSFLIPLTIGLSQLCFIYVGNFVGEKFGLLWGKRSKWLEMTPGILLICLALTRI